MKHIKCLITLQILDAKCVQFVSNSLRLKRIRYNSKHTYVGCNYLKKRVPFNFKYISKLPQNYKFFTQKILHYSIDKCHVTLRNQDHHKSYVYWAVHHLAH